jgi:membrane protease YdiL (CAAX protease family)
MNTQTISLPTRVLALVGIEAIAWLLTQMVLAQYPWSSFVAESLRTLLRFETLVFDWYLFRQTIQAQASHARIPRESSLTIAVLLMLIGPLLMPHPQLRPMAAGFFAVSGVIVGLKEEVLFRAILQPLLQRRLGTLAAVVSTSIIFTAWHGGAIPLTPEVAGEIFLASVVLGLLYAASGSLLLVVSLHTAYDALYVLIPGATQGARQYWMLLPLAAAVGALLLRGGRAAGAPRIHGVQAPATTASERATPTPLACAQEAAPWRDASNALARRRCEWVGPV